MADLLKKLNEASEHLQHFLTVLSEWKAENAAHRARLDMMGDELLKTLENVQIVANEFLQNTESLKSNKSVAEPKSIGSKLTGPSSDSLRRSPRLQPQSSASEPNQVNAHLKQKDTNRVVIKKEIGSVGTTSALSKLTSPMKKLSNPMVLLSQIQMKKEPHVTPISTFTLKRQSDILVPEIVPQILRTTRSHARILLDKDIRLQRSVSLIQGMASTSAGGSDRTSKQSPEHLKKPLKRLKHHKGSKKSTDAIETSSKSK